MSIDEIILLVISAQSERSDDAFHDEIFGDSPAGTWKTVS